MKSRLSQVGFFLSMALVFTAASPAAARKQAVAPAAAGGIVQLPYVVNDTAGYNWMIYQNGMLQQQGNRPLYSQGAMLIVNGNQPEMRNNQAELDAKTKEVVFSDLNAGGLAVTRRVLVDLENSYVRYIDIIKNPQAQEQTLNVQLQSHLNYGINAAQFITDPKQEKQQIAWVAQTGAGPSVVELFSGKGAKVGASIQWAQGNNQVQAMYTLKAPGNGQVAIMHLHRIANGQQAGAEFVTMLKESQLMSSLPRELRKIIVNFPQPQSHIGDRELLRGELFDVIELRGGDQLQGNLKETGFKLQTFYGAVELPVERVIAMLNVGQFRPRQLLVTREGEIFGGKLEKETLAMELSSGQTIQVPLSQVTRMGYRKRAGEPEEWTFDKPFVLMRSGDRVAVQVPPEPIEVMTRFGRLQIQPQALAAIVFQSEEQGVHEIQLTDGSRFAGLVTAEQFQMKLADGVQAVQFPVTGMSRLQASAAVVEIDEETMPALRLATGDVLVGTLGGELKLDTAFDTIALNAAEIRTLQHTGDSGVDVQVSLWDQSTVSGQLQEQQLRCEMSSGVSIDVPVALVQHYSQPQPQPSAMLLEKIKSLVGELNADDWKQRDRAEAQLVSMGAVVLGTLKQARETQSPEAQQRIDAILKQLQVEAATPGAAPLAPQ